MKISVNDIATTMIAAILIGGGTAYINMWRKDFNSIKEKVQTMEGKIQTMEGKVQNVEERVKNVEERVQNIEEKVHILEEDVLNIEQRNKPSYMSEDRWNLNEGVRKFEEKQYDSALINFNKISELSGNDFVKWKYYESLCKFKLLRYQKYRKLDPISLTEVEEIEYALRSLITNHPDNRFSEEIKYWLAQTLFHFKDQPKEALLILEELKNEYPKGKWKEGTLYYMAESLLRLGDEEDRESAVNYLKELLHKYPDGVIRIIEEDDLYRVRNVVRIKLANIEE